MLPNLPITAIPPPPYRVRETDMLQASTYAFSLCYSHYGWFVNYEAQTGHSQEDGHQKIDQDWPC